MCKLKLIIIFSFLMAGTNAMAYFGNSAGHSKHSDCKAPTIRRINPTHLSVVPSQSEFSFIVSDDTVPRSIIVTVKKIPVDVEIKEVKRGYIVSAKLPDSLKETFARIEAKFKGTNRCKGSKGWLLNIRDS